MKKRILFILHLPPPVHGSSVVGKQIRYSERIHAGWESRFINLNTSPSTDAIGKVGPRKLWTYARILLRTFCTLALRRPDSAYIAMTVKGGGFFKDLGVITLVKLFRVPIVYHLHNKGVAARQHRWPDRWLYPWVFRKSRVVLLSPYLYSDIARFVPESAVAYCPNGIPDEATGFQRNSDSSVSPVILFLSNLIESKGVGVLLEACALLKQKGLRFRAEFVGGEGDVSAKDFARRVAALDLNDRVKYLGRQYGIDKQAAFVRADVFCLPTHYHNECLPLVLLEAMQWRLPVVATPEGGIRDVVVDGETGFLVPQRDPAALAEKLTVLLEDPKLRERMGEAGRQRYEEHFTAEKFEERMLEILSGGLAERRVKGEGWRVEGEG